MEHINIKSEINGELSNGTGGGKYDNISIVDKTPTPALFTQHYISLAC
jgi:hypothetical protein